MFRTARSASLLWAPLALLGVHAVHANAFVVDRFDDTLDSACTPAPDDCSLRGAILAANTLGGEHSIPLAAGTYELSIDNTAGGGEAERGDLDLTAAITMIATEGPAVIDANDLDRVFDIDVPVESGALYFQGLTITGGAPWWSPIATPTTEDKSGGGARILDGRVEFVGCSFLYNTAAGGWGGAIYHASDYQLDVHYSLVSGNSASNGGAIVATDLVMKESSVLENETNAGGTLWFRSVGFVERSTVGENIFSTDCDAEGAHCGAILVDADALQVVVASTTVAHNERHAFVSEPPPGADFAPLTLRNTLVSGDCLAPNGGIDTEGGNLESPDETCLLGDDDLFGVPGPVVEATASNHGGATPTYLPLAGTLSIDFAAADAGCLPYDQRWADRPADGDGDATAHCDIGAVELQGPGEFFAAGFEDGTLAGWSSVAP